LKKSKLFLSLFLIVSLAELVALQMEWDILHLISKPLIVLSLIGYYWSLSNARSMVFVVALLFCWAGDVFLLFQDGASFFFLLGLVSFLIGHVLYILSYRYFRWKDTSRGLLGTQKVRLALPIILAGTGLVVVLYPSLADLKIPVMIYALVLTLMVLNAVFRYERTSSGSFWFAFAGAVLFMISDSLLAINKFMNPLPQASLLIMLTYIAAQYLIVEGMLRHVEED
jgi:uncharacterized membrane protein YhhN